MNKKIKIFLRVIVAFLIVFVAYIFYMWIFSTCCEPKPTPTERDQRLKDPNLLYASSWWAGLCSNDKNENGGCYGDSYLYKNGQFIKKSGFQKYDGPREDNQPIEKQLSAVELEQFIRQIKDSGIMTKDCPTALIDDAGWDFQIEIDGVKKSFHNSVNECRDILESIDATLKQKI